jgi:hypothetical protein
LERPEFYRARELVQSNHDPDYEHVFEGVSDTVGLAIRCKRKRSYRWKTRKACQEFQTHGSDQAAVLIKSSIAIDDSEQLLSSQCKKISSNNKAFERTSRNSKNKFERESSNVFSSQKVGVGNQRHHYAK